MSALSIIDTFLELFGKAADIGRKITGKKKILKPITDEELGKRPAPPPPPKR